MKAIYPGSFDPITLGHLNIIERALKIFDEVIVVVANNDSKKHMFSFDERKRIIEESISDIQIPENKQLYIIGTTGIVSDSVKEFNADAIIRGVRNATDLDYEIKLEQYTRNTCDAETVYLSPYTEHLNTSSSLVRMFLQTNKTNTIDKYLSKSAIKYISRIKEIK